MSPLLANIALCGLETDLLEAFPRARVIAGEKVRTPLRLIVYADDFVVLHAQRPVIEAAQVFIAHWLAPLGLSLSATKTSIRHTVEKTDGERGFTFLGCKIRQHRVGKHQASSHFKGLHTHIGPSKEARKRIYAKAAAIIDATRPGKKRNAQRALREAAGAPTPQERIIHRLNPLLRGWANYYRPHNSKRDFSELDDKLFKKLFRWTKRHHPKLTSPKLVKTFFNGGAPWAFKAPARGSRQEAILLRVDTTPIQRHYPVRSEASFYDGDWAYWGKRLGRYPSLPDAQIARRLKRQSGKCHLCREEILSIHRVVLQEVAPLHGGNPIWHLVHENCGAGNCGDMPSGARCGGSRTPGSETP